MEVVQVRARAAAAVVVFGVKMFSQGFSLQQRQEERRLKSCLDFPLGATPSVVPL